MNSAASGSLSSLAQKVSALQSELASINLEDSLGKEAAARMGDPAGAAGAKVLAHLQELKGAKQQQQQQQPDKKQGGDSAASAVTYELLMRPESARLEEGERAAALERRLDALEKALGSADSQTMVGEQVLLFVYFQILQY